MAIALFLYSRRFAGLTETRYFQALTLLTAAWSILQAIDISLTDLSEKVLLMKLKFTVAPFINVVVFGLLTSHSGRDSWLTRRNLALISIVPVITIALAFTVESHDLFLFNFSVFGMNPPILESVPGPWYWAYLIYSYAVMLASIMLLIDSARGANTLYKRQAVILLCAFLPPAIFDLLDNYGLLPVEGVDFAFAAFAISGAIIAWGLYRYRILDVRPIARSEVVENMTDILLVVDLEGRLIDYNRATDALLARSSKTAMGASVSDALPFGESLGAMLDGNGDRAEVTLGEGADRHIFEASIMPVEVKGELRARMVLLRDMTERKRVDEALHAANARLGLLTSLTRHDILNKLTVIDGYVALARQENDLDKAKNYLAKLGLASDAARSLITFTKDYESVGIRAPSWHVVDDLFARAAGQLALEQVTVTTSTDGLRVYADAMIEKAFYNLLDNTLRHGGAVSHITLSCQERGDGLVLIYRDDGGGIPLKDKGRIFERGFGKHTGLGLFLIREVLAITGIEIAETGEQGKGARFEMSVPRGAYRFEPPVCPAAPSSAEDADNGPTSAEPA